MLVRIFDIPSPLQSEVLAEELRHTIAHTMQVEPETVQVSLSSIKTRHRGKHNVSFTGITPKQAHRQRVTIAAMETNRFVDMYFYDNGYLFYGFANPQLALPPL